MTDQDNNNASSEMPTPLIEQRLMQLQSSQMIGQFQFFSFISLVSIITVSFLYWDEPNTLFLSTKTWSGLSVFSVCLSIALMSRLKHNFQEYRAYTIEKFINATALMMGGVWGVAAVVFSPSFPINGAPLNDFYRPALFACLVSWQAIAALTSYSSRFETFIYFAVAAILPGLLLLTAYPSVVNSALTGVGGLFFFFVLLAGRRLSDLSYQSLWLQLRNEDLIHFLESSKSTVEAVNQKLAQEIQERRHTESQLQEVNIHLEQKVRERTLALSDINRALRNSQERLTLAIDASGIGLWDWNMSNNEIFNSNFEQLLGYSKLEMKALMGNMKQIIHPDDYSNVKRALLQHLRKKKAEL